MIGNDYNYLQLIVGILGVFYLFYTIKHQNITDFELKVLSLQHIYQ